MKKIPKISGLLFIALAMALSCYGCVTSTSSERDKFAVAAELDTRENSKKLDQLSKNISDHKETIDGFQTDIRYLREEVDKLKNRVEEAEERAKAAGKPGTPEGSAKIIGKKEKFKEGDIVAAPPPSIEDVKSAREEASAEPQSPAAGDIKTTSLKPEDYYQNAYDDLRFGEYESAIEGFRKFIEQYPGDKLAGNAQYWIGECYYGMKDFKKAAEEFKKVLENYPKGNKVPDARLKHALCLYDLKEVDLCLAELEKLVSEYKGASIADAASKQIERLRSKRK
ncbi:MAG: tol-pal system protein YbgF [Nitrospinae bacterium]|nr:tol-pal system protein YbgF [Nitrospinota bacterium]